MKGNIVSKTDKLDLVWRSYINVESFYCTPETNTTYQLYFNKKDNCKYTFQYFLSLMEPRMQPPPPSPTHTHFGDHGAKTFTYPAPLCTVADNVRIGSDDSPHLTFTSCSFKSKWALSHLLQSWVIKHLCSWSFSLDWWGGFNTGFSLSFSCTIYLVMVSPTSPVRG